MKQIFVDRTNTLRSGWRFAVFFAAFLFLAATLAAIEYVVLPPSGSTTGQSSLTALAVNRLLQLIAALIVGWLCGKYFEGVPFRALGAWFTKLWASHLFLGIVMGTATVSLAVLIAVVFGGLRFTFPPADGFETILRSLLMSFVVFAVAAASEEALFRGYILPTFNRAGLGWLAVVLTSAFFGMAHLDNPNSNAFSTLNTVLAGVWFSIAYLKTRDLWFVWGMHLMWNWVMGSVFGIEVSGLTFISTSPILKEVDRGPIWLTGEGYGLEGGIACTAAIIISGAIIYFSPLLKADPEMVALTSRKEHHPNMASALDVVKASGS